MIAEDADRRYDEVSECILSDLHVSYPQIFFKKNLLKKQKL